MCLVGSRSIPGLGPQRTVDITASTFTHIAVFLPLAFALRHTAFYRTGVVRVGSLVIAALAAWWLVERAFDL